MNIAKKKPEGSRLEAEAPRPRKLVYTNAPVLLGRLLGRDLDGWRVDIGTIERTAVADSAVDPSLLAEALESGARVLVDASADPVIVGVVMTRRALEIDRVGDVKTRVRTFEIDASESVLLKVPGAFVRAKARQVEVYGDRVLTRARDLAKILAAMIKLN